MRLQYILPLFLLGLLLMTAPTQTAASNLQDNDTTITVLPNGFTIAVKQDKRFPLASLRLYVKAGSAYETPDEAGISHILEHMVFKGTKHFPKGGIAAAIEGSGGYLNAATSFDYTVYLTDVTQEHWRLGLDVLKDMAFSPTLDKNELESEKEVILAELKRGEDSVPNKAFRIAQGLALRPTTYKNPIIGYEETIKATTSEKIRAYIAKYYQPQSMLLLVCGDVDQKEVIQAATELFGGLHNTHPLSPVFPFADDAVSPSTVPHVETGPWNKVHLTLTLPTGSQADSRTPALDVLAHVLGGDSTSRFYQKYKYEKRLVDSISVSNYSFERLGLLYISVTLDADKLAPFWQAFVKDLSNVHAITFTTEELNRAKLAIEDDLFRSKETLSGLTAKIGYFQLFGKGEYDEVQYLQGVTQTDATNLTNLAGNIFRKDKLSVVCLLPENADVAKQPQTTTEMLQAALATEWKTSEAQPLQTAAANMPKQAEIIDLGHGRQLVLLPDPTMPYASVNVLFSGGNSLLTPDQQGLGAFTAGLINKGPQSMNATAYEVFQSDRAASIQAASNRQSFGISFDTPSRFLPDMFGMLNQLITSPAMLPEEAERVKESQIARITVQEDQPTGFLFRHLFPFLFGDNHPYGYLQLGTKERVAKLSAEDATAFWNKQKVQPYVITICGTYEKDIVKAAASALPIPSAQKVVPKAPSWTKEKSLSLELPGREQAHLVMVFPAVGTGHEDEAALDLLQNILAGQSGLLFSDLRDKQGLGYTVTAFPWKTPNTGAIIFYIGTDPDKVEVAKAGFKKVVDNLHNTLLPAEEVKRGQNQMLGDYYREHQSLGARSGEAAALTLLNRPLDAEKTKLNKAQKITAKDLQLIAKKYLVLDKAYTATVLP